MECAEDELGRVHLGDVREEERPPWSPAIARGGRHADRASDLYETDAGCESYGEGRCDQFDRGG